MPRLSEKQKAVRAQQALKAERYARQEEKRAPRVQIDQLPTMVVLMVLGGLIFIATAALTADGTVGSAAAARYTVPWFAFLMFFATEVAVLGLLLIYYMLGSRTDDETGEPVPAIHWFWGSVAASVVAAALSVYHVLDLYEYDWVSIDMWVGVGIRLTTTVLFVVISKGLANVIFAKSTRQPQ